MSGRFSQVGEVGEDLERTQVYEHGWQSWSPAGLYPATATSPRPKRAIWQTMAFRPGRPAPTRGFQGEGLLAVVHADGSATGWFASQPAVSVPSVRASVEGERLVVSSDGPVTERSDPRGLAPLVEAWAAEVGAASVGALPVLEPGWCSWYCHGNRVSEADVVTALDAIEARGLPIGTLQVDDGYQAEIGDWLDPSNRFSSVADLARRIAARGLRPGVWTAPFLVGERSAVARRHPDWLVGDAVACEHHWGQRVGVLDVTHPAAAEHLGLVFRTLRSWGFTYFKLDFLYAGAMDGRRHGAADPIEAYREGLRIVRDAVGSDAVLLGCGAPLLPSIGLVDAMRISPDVDAKLEPPDGDVSQPGGRSARCAGRARAWMHGRFWLNDPDCLIVRPEVEERDAWARHVAASGGLVVSSDRFEDLDDHGWELLAAGLRPTLPEPVSWSPEAT